MHVKERLYTLLGGSELLLKISALLMAGLRDLNTPLQFKK
jgi:hypothetical protein